MDVTQIPVQNMTSRDMKIVGHAGENPFHHEPAPHKIDKSNEIPINDTPNTKISLNGALEKGTIPSRAMFNAPMRDI